MSVLFLSTHPDPPPGYHQIFRPRKSDLLRGTVVLLVSSDPEGEKLLEGLWGRFCGVVLIPEGNPSWEKKGDNAWKLLWPLDRITEIHPVLELWARSITQERNAQRTTTVWEKEVSRLNREQVWIREHYHLVTEKLRKNVDQVSKLNRDLHDQLERAGQAEAALSRSEHDLAGILDSIGDAVVATDDRMKIRRMNPAAEVLSGWKREAAVGESLLVVFPLRSVPGNEPLSDPVKEILEREEALDISRKHLLLGRDESEIRLAPSASPILDDGGKTIGYVFVFRDKTRQYQMEEELRQRQSLDALGQLAGGVAHEFNNLLAGINGFAELLEMNLIHDNSSLDLLKSIKNTVERASGLTRQLLSFARRHVSQMKVLDLHRLVQEVLNLAAHTFDRRIIIETRLEATPPFIMGESALLQTVLLNLFINSRDAMPEGGRLTVRSADLPADEAKVVCQVNQDFITLTVEDTGIGIPENQLERIFEPFFTTKSPGMGTGLGLSALYGIMQEHKGQVKVSSRQGEGTRFTLYFPKTSQMPAPIQEEDEKNRHPGRILVVDDEEYVRKFLKTGLERHGYSVALSDNGLQGVKTVSDDPTAFDIVVIDINMPFMNGRDALAAIRPTAPHLPVILISGYITEDDLEELKRLGAAAVLSKPFSIRDLLKRIDDHIRR